LKFTNEEKSIASVKFVLGQSVQEEEFESLVRYFGKWASLQETDETSDAIKLFEVKPKI